MKYLSLYDLLLLTAKLCETKKVELQVTWNMAKQIVTDTCSSEGSSKYSSWIQYTC